MNKAELIEVLTKELDTDRRSATDAVEHFVNAIVRAVHKGESVTITGFGVFERRRRAARVARNPRTGETVKVKPTSVPAFRPGAQFKAIVSGAQRVPSEGLAVKRGAGAGTTAAKKAAKKSPAKKATKAAAKKTAAKAPARKAAKAAPKKATKATKATKAAVKKAPAKKVTAKKTAAKKAPAKKVTAKKTAAKKAPVRKAATKAPAKKATAKKTAAKKAPAKKGTKATARKGRK
jgi:DNA-binding protein HU-beta